MRAAHFDRESELASQPAQHVLFHLHGRWAVRPDGELRIVDGSQQIAGNRFGQRRGVEVAEVARVDCLHCPILEHAGDIVDELHRGHGVHERIGLLEVPPDYCRIVVATYWQLVQAVEVLVAAAQGLGDDLVHGFVVEGSRSNGKGS